MPIKPLRLSAYTQVTALGRGVAASLAALQKSRSGLRPCNFPDTPLATWIGRIDGLEEESIVGELARFDCRNNRLAQLGLQQDHFWEAVTAARSRYGATRIGVFIGTSTSGVQQTEQAYRHCDPHTGKLPDDFLYPYTQNMFSVTDFICHSLDLAGPSMTISTACSSSAKAFATASRHIQAGLCDAALVGGVDSLCQTTLYGFNALGLVSAQPCRPWDKERDGINIGEAVGLVLLEPVSPEETGGVVLVGYGESNDAYHISSPHPDGKGAALAMQRALASANVHPAEVDYINLHGTASRANDLAEDHGVVSVFGTHTPCSSTKGWTGHTLGAAGITEAIFVTLCLTHQFLPGTLHTQVIDPQLSAQVLLTTEERRLRYVLTNSFGFGGSNCSLLFGKGL